MKKLFSIILAALLIGCLFSVASADGEPTVLTIGSIITKRDFENDVMISCSTGAFSGPCAFRRPHGAATRRAIPSAQPGCTSARRTW